MSDQTIGEMEEFRAGEAVSFRPRGSALSGKLESVQLYLAVRTSPIMAAISPDW